MSKENLRDEINSCIVNLQRLAMITCWNKISSNFVFIVSDFNEFEGNKIFERRRFRNRANKPKTRLSLDSAIKMLDKEYPDLYDLTLYIFKAGQKETVIEIQYYRKSNFEPDYFDVVKDNPPMFHSKISKPYYVSDHNRFDINWELGGVRYFWNHFLAQIKYKINTLNI